MREKLVIWGAGSTAIIVADIIRFRDSYQICAFLDSVNPERARTEFWGASIMGGENNWMTCFSKEFATSFAPAALAALVYSLRSWPLPKDFSWPLPSILTRQLPPMYRLAQL
jgi:hypothetical protein